MTILLSAGTLICALVAMAMAAGGIVLVSQYAPVVGPLPGLIVTVFALISLAASVYLVIAGRHRPAIEAAATLLAIVPSALILGGSLFIGGLPAGVNWTLWIGLALLVGTASAAALGLSRMRGSRSRVRKPARQPAPPPIAIDAERPRLRVPHSPPEQPEVRSSEGRPVDLTG